MDLPNLRPSPRSPTSPRIPPPPSSWRLFPCSAANTPEATPTTESLPPRRPAPCFLAAGAAILLATAIPWLAATNIHPVRPPPASAGSTSHRRAMATGATQPSRGATGLNLHAHPRLLPGRSLATTPLSPSDATAHEPFTFVTHVRPSTGHHVLLPELHGVPVAAFTACVRPSCLHHQSRRLDPWWLLPRRIARGSSSWTPSTSSQL